MPDPALVDMTFDADETGFRGSGDGSFGSEFPSHLIYPESEWRDRIKEIEDNNPFKGGPHPDYALMANYAPDRYCFNQSPESSCVANACTNALMRRWAFAMSKPGGIILSPMSLYVRICSSRHSGAYTQDGLEEIAENGALPSDKHEGDYDVTYHENAPYPGKGWSALPSGSQEQCKDFRVTEWLQIRSFEQYGSALLNQFPVVMGRSGHSMVAEDLLYDGGWYARICDSYGWNNRDGTGRVYDSERTMRNSVGGAWACRTTTLPEQHDPSMGAK